VTEFVAVDADEPEPTPDEKSYSDPEPDPKPIEVDDIGDLDAPDLEEAGFSTIPKKRPPGSVPWNPTVGLKSKSPADKPEPEGPKLKLGVKAATPQSELSLDSTPRGRFEGENPNVFDGEDLDLPPFLRKKK
jgi:cell division protein FtsZ